MSKRTVTGVTLAWYRRPRSGHVAWMLACLALTAQADTACEISPLPGTSPEVHLADLMGLESRCHKHAPYLFALGQFLNQLGRYEEAIDPLEGALMYRPDHWQTQLEYAIALEGVGDRQSALSQLHNLLHNPGLDSETRTQIEALARKRPLAYSHRRTGAWGLATGLDNNVFGNTYHSHFTLTTPDGALAVELDPDQQARAGTFARADVTLDGILTFDDGVQWRYGLGASHRATPHTPSADQGQWSVLLERSGTGERSAYVLGQAQAMLRSGTPLLQQIQFGTGYDFPLSTVGQCRQRLGFDALSTTYPTSNVLDGRYIGLLSHTNCPAWGLQVQLRAGQDDPIDTNRPGGQQQQSVLRVSKLIQLGAAALALDWEATYRQDRSGYSTLLANNAPRDIRRYVYRTEYRWQAGSLRPYLGAEWLDQQANVPLFELRNVVITLGFRSQW